MASLMARGQKDSTFSSSIVGDGTPTSNQTHQTEGGLDVGQPAKYKGSSGGMSLSLSHQKTYVLVQSFASQR